MVLSFISKKDRSHLLNQTISLNVGVTKSFPCSYLNDQEERLLMLVDPEINAHAYYYSLIENGFRRSGDQVYRPHCENCQACQSLRIPVNNFIPSRSQKRLLNKNKHFSVKVTQSHKPNYFDLYQKYIEQVHSDGVMFPTSTEQYEQFINSSWNQPLFIEVYDRDKLISVSITDQINNGSKTLWSAFYCFYDPDYRASSLGKYAVLTQLRLAKESDIDWLYLGYYIEKCNKMNYKTQFNPHQRFIDGQWLSFNTKK